MNSLLAGLLLASALGSALQAQQPAQRPGRATEEDEKTRIILDVTRVNILFTVTDKRGRFITDLTKNDFEVVDNKKQQSIMEFTAETDLPLRMAILVDTSNSIRDRFRFIQEAAVEFVNSVVRPRQDRALIVSFDTQAELVAELSDDPEMLAKNIRDLRPGGGTSLYDAIFYASRDKLAVDQPRHKYRRAMIILSDGEDNLSRVTRDQALEMAQKADVVIYSISTNITRIETDGDKVLKYLASETGGQAFFPFKVEDPSQNFENIANEPRHQYNIFYRPEPLKTDGLYHEVTLKVKGRKDFVVRCRKGYYAPSL
jgi:VWFA-related protein